MNSKKVMAFALAVLSTCVCSASAFAYVSSPSHSLPAANKSGTTQGVEKNGNSSSSDSDDADDSKSDSSSKSDDEETYRAVGYSKNETLTEEQQEEFTECYTDVKETTDLTKLVPEIKTIASDKGVKASNTAVSDIFYSVLSNSKRNSKTVRIKAKNLDKFVALLCYSDGEWTVVEDARIDAKGRLVFKTKPSAVYAIVIDTTEETAE